MTEGALSIGLNFTQACRFLDLTPEDFTELRRQGFVACINVDDKQIYPHPVLEFAQQLLLIGQTHSWGSETLAWYADLVFTTEIGRAILLPLMDKKMSVRSLPTSWLETPHVSAVLQGMEPMLSEKEGPLITLLCSLVAATIGEGQYWPDREAISKSALYPIIAHFEALGVPILGQGASIPKFCPK
jgi:hypothetical protein